MYPHCIRWKSSHRFEAAKPQNKKKNNTCVGCSQTKDVLKFPDVILLHVFHVYSDHQPLGSPVLGLSSQSDSLQFLLEINWSLGQNGNHSIGQPYQWWVQKVIRKVLENPPPCKVPCAATFSACFRDKNTP